MPAPQQSELIRFLSSNGYLLRGRSDTRPITHTLMDGHAGGKIALPNEASSEFFAAYGKDLYAGVPLFVIERRSTVFNMHFDVDFSGLLDNDRVGVFCDLLHSTVNEYFKTPRRCIVCAITDSSKQERRGAGLHIIFPRTPVSDAQALAIRAGVVARCKEQLAWGTDWDKTIDVCVLTGGGSLRMVGSDKCRTCQSCNNAPEARPYCGICCRQGHVAEGKVYWPWRVLPQEDPGNRQDLEDMHRNVAYAARVCSTRTTLEVPSRDFQMPSGAPLPSRLVRVRNEEGRFELQLQDPQPSTTGLKLRGAADFRLPASETALLTKTIQAYSSAHKSVVVKSITSFVQQNSICYVVRVGGFGSRYCLNKMSDHTSQNIYFVVKPIGLAQRCFCRKPDVRPGGSCPCGQFTGPFQSLPPALHEALFSQQEVENSAEPPQDLPGTKRSRRSPSCEPREGGSAERKRSKMLGEVAPLGMANFY